MGCGISSLAIYAEEGLDGKPLEEKHTNLKLGPPEHTVSKLQSEVVQSSCVGSDEPRTLKKPESTNDVENSLVVLVDQKNPAKSLTKQWFQDPDSGYAQGSWSDSGSDLPNPFHEDPNFFLTPPVPTNEHARLAKLYSYNILDTGFEKSFDRIVELTSDIYNVPIAIISLVDTNRQWFKSVIGLECRDTGRDVSFCGHAILRDRPLIILDASKDWRFARNPLVIGPPFVSFYAGAPLRTWDGYNLGTLCIIDTRARTSVCTAQLEQLSAIVVRELELWAAGRNLQIREAQQKSLAEFGRKALAQNHLAESGDLAVRKIAETLQADISFFLQLTTDDERLFLRSSVGLDPPLLALPAYSSRSQDDCLDPTDYPLLNERANTKWFAEVLRNGEAFISSTIPDSCSRNMPEFLGKAAAVSGIGVSVYDSVVDKPIGILGAFSKSSKFAFGDQAMSYLQNFSSAMTAVVHQYHTREVLRKTEAQTRAVVDSARDAIIISDLDLIIVSINEAAEELFSCFERDAVGRHASELMLPPLREALLDNSFIECARNGEIVSTLAKRFDCTTFIAEVVISSIMDADRRYGYSLVVRDVTLRVHESERAEKLLYNVLPRSVADHLKEDPSPVAQGYANASVMFADIVGFSQLSKRLTPDALVLLLNHVFCRFDQLAEKHGVEKIKTIGDAYMAVSGIPDEREDHARALVEFALDVLRMMHAFNQQFGHDIQVRIGINSGPTVAGVIGLSKFVFDVFGDSVNIASRMESTGMPGRIHVSENTYHVLEDQYVWEPRGRVFVKGMGEMNTYFFLSRISEDPLAETQDSPSWTLTVPDVVSGLFNQEKPALRRLSIKKLPLTNGTQQPHSSKPFSRVGSMHDQSSAVNRDPSPTDDA